MTAEIAVMNKLALALAADSAVTIETGQGHKIYNTVNKLFTLSKYRPVGIMVYGRAELLRVPWESLIKIYRRRLGRTGFGWLSAYANDFIGFLRRSSHLFPEPVQREHVVGAVIGYYLYIRNEIKESVKKEITRGRVTDAQVKKIVAETVLRHLVRLGKKKSAPGLSAQHAADVARKYRKEFIDARRKAFGELPLSRETERRLDAITRFLLHRAIFPDNHSGVVVAGFGEKETFPSLEAFIVDGMVDGRLKYRRRDDVSLKVGFGNNAAIVPFAQTDMVETFMEGINPFYARALAHYLTQLIDDLSACILGSCSGAKGRRAAIDAGKLKSASKKLVDEFRSSLDRHKRETHVNPVIQTVAVLPKDELAAMAETLVSLTSFKRRMSLTAETVGGPIDVAVISKGDGFVWIKRKHYFRQELNPHFVANYYREG